MFKTLTIVACSTVTLGVAALLIDGTAQSQADAENGSVNPLAQTNTDCLDSMALKTRVHFQSCKLSALH